MSLFGKKDGLILLAGDLIVFIVALWLALALRYLAWPSIEFFGLHLGAFLPLFFIWILVFFIADLYRRQTLVLARNLPVILFRAQVLNSIIAVLAFYFVPFFARSGLAPKTNLFIYLLTTLPLLSLWRVYLFEKLSDRRPVTVSFVCEGAEVEELKQEIKRESRHRLALVSENPALIVFNKYDDGQDHLWSDFYRRFFRGVQFVPIHHFYEAVFERVPLSMVNEKWFLENISNQPQPWYSLIKRVMDLVLGLILVILSLPFYLIIPALIKLEDGGPVFFRQERIGRGGQVFQILKFRSMSAAHEVTEIGGFLRRTRIDELPQLWSIVRGEQSLIGPRPEKPDYVALYRSELPYYDARHLIEPGLSGWAQLYQENHPHFQSDLAATREKLSYDLYYLKNRGWWLDVKIALKTLRALVSHRGI